MKKSLEERTKSVDLDSMTEEERGQLSKNIGSFITTNMTKTLKEIKDLLDVYGFDFHIMYEMTPRGALPMWKRPEWYKSMIPPEPAKPAKKTPPKKRPAAKKKSSAKKKPAVRKKPAKKTTPNKKDGKI
jgi:hypothetical protein